MIFKKYFLIRLKLPNGHTLHLAGDGSNFRIRGRPYRPIEINNLQYNFVDDENVVVHEAKLEVDI